MLRTETVEKRTLDLIKRLIADERLKEFYLVGGTALALRIGHRSSIDIDLFTGSDFDAPTLGAYLASQYKATNLRTTSNVVLCFIDDIKIDLIAHQYPLVEKIEALEGIRLASLLDIAAMKLNAIYNNGTRLKDFVDIYALLEYYPLQKLLSACEQKYQDINTGIVRKALLHHTDIDFSVPIGYIGKELTWPQIAERLQTAVQNPNLTFAQTSEQTRKLMEKLRKNEQSKNRGHRL